MEPESEWRARVRHTRQLIEISRLLRDSAADLLVIAVRAETRGRVLLQHGKKLLVREDT